MFVEKPATETAEKLVRRGALWNTQAFACKLKTLKTVFQHTPVELYRSLQAISDLAQSSHEKRVAERMYGLPRPVNFFKDILHNLSYELRRNLFVLPVQEVSFLTDEICIQTAERGSDAAANSYPNYFRRSHHCSDGRGRALRP